MKECICNTCKNLIEVISENGLTGEFECVHGYPDSICENCETEECELECEYYIDAESEPVTSTVACSVCGKAMQTDDTDPEDGTYFCVDCYLERTL